MNATDPLATSSSTSVGKFSQLFSGAASACSYLGKSVIYLPARLCKGLVSHFESQGVIKGAIQVSTLLLGMGIFHELGEIYSQLEATSTLHLQEQDSSFLNSAIAVLLALQFIHYYKAREENRQITHALQIGNAHLQAIGNRVSAVEGMLRDCDPHNINLSSFFDGLWNLFEASGCERFVGAPLQRTLLGPSGSIVVRV